ncbi:MAG: ribosome maturation factor RimP [Desertimonas sp.]
MEHDSPVVTRVRELVAPVASDLGLDVYDIELRGGTLRVTLDTPAGSDGGITLDDLALASRLVSRQLDERDPVPGRYNLEVTSPGVERALRTPAQFRRELGKAVNLRLRDVSADERRISGTLSGADDDGVTVEVVGDGPRTFAYEQIDRARTVFEWGPAPKPGKGARGGKAIRPAATSNTEHSDHGHTNAAPANTGHANTGHTDQKKETS